MKALTSEAPEPRADRYASRLVHDEPNARVVSFLLAEGQAVPPHESPSTVTIHVVEGTGRFRGEDGELRLGPGGAAVYAPGETHSMEADGGPLRFLAVITPRPA